MDAKDEHAGHTHEDGEKEETWADKLFRELTGEPSTENKLKELAEKRDLFSEKEAIGYADQKKKLVLETLGYHVFYKPLRVQDRIELASIKDPDPAIQTNKFNRKKVQLILQRAYPDVTEDTVNKMSANIVDTILIEYDLEEDARFLSPLIRRRSNGLKRT